MQTSFETNFEAKNIYPYIKEMSLLRFGYIDDFFTLFTIWKNIKPG